MIEQAPKLSESVMQKSVKLLAQPGNASLFVKIDDDYLYWDKVKYLAVAGIDPIALWGAVKLRRSINAVGLQFGKYSFHFTVTSAMQSLLHELDMAFLGSVDSGSIIPQKERNLYLASSLMEEAIASSQMEGASTTRRVAKDMLRKQMKPQNKSQQMIVNNYATIRYLVDNRQNEMTVDYLKEIHRYISNRTLANPEYEGRLRKDDNILVMNDITGEIVHMPPKADELESLLGDLCEFANDETDTPFIHPIVKGIIIHFMLAYFHPFVDGNGRSSRSLVYWYMLKKGYWLTEYLSISRIIYRSKAQYERSFLYTECDGLDLSYFINYNLKAMKSAYDDLNAYLRKKKSEQDDLASVIGVAGINERQSKMVKIFAEHPNSILTANEIKTRFGVTAKTARADLQHLVALGLLVARPVNKRKSCYVRAERFADVLAGLVRSGPESR